MVRSLFAPFIVFALALSVLLGGCGGGGGGGNNGGSGGNDGGSAGSAIVRDLSGIPLTGAVVKFYGPSGAAELGRGVVLANGSLPSNVPAGATRFSIDASSILDGSSNPRYYSTFLYGDDYYDDSSACYAALPQQGSSSGFSENIYFFARTSPPPPPPTGCVATQ